MGGFENDVMVAKNINFNGTAPKPHLGILNAAGKIPIGTGNTSPTPEILGGNITSPLGTLSIGYSSPNITLDIAGGASAVEHLTGDTGGQLNPTANNFNVLGSGSITIAGSGSTLTTQLTGLTNHSVLVGAGTSTITKVGPTATAGQVLQSAGSSADPAFSTATYPATATGTGKILRADGTNWSATTATYPNTAGTSGNVLTSDGTNWVSSSAPGAGLLSATGTLTSAQVKALHATPIQAIAAPGSGNVIVVIQSCAKLTYGGNNAFTTGSGQTIEVYYGTATNVVGSSSALVKTTILTSTSNQFNIVSGSGTGASAFGMAYSSVVNTAINLYNPNASEIAGNAANDNTIQWLILYYIVTM